MNEDISQIVNELHIYEKKLLKSLENKDNQSPEEIANENDMDIKSVMSAAGSLSSKDIIIMDKVQEVTVSLSEEGKKYALNGLPERKILEALSKEESIHMKDLTEMFPSEFKIAMGWLMRKRWAINQKGNLSITEIGESYLDKLGNDELALNKLHDEDSIFLNLEEDEDILDGIASLKKRKGLLDSKKHIDHHFKLTEKGFEILKFGFDIKEEATQMTNEHLKTGQWKELSYRPYDINASYPEFFAGKKHPLRIIIDEIRRIFLNLGFEETRGNILDSTFWNFDSLFQPQDHAAREMQDTFYVKNPETANLPDEKLVKKTAEVHENGGNTDSEGWHYDWDVDVAKQSVLRTHTTGISTRFLNENEPPLKMFSVGRVFRRETITYKHLPEFHQVEGIVADESINFSNLIGILNEFYKQLGFEVRFRPAYFPYTYLSTECEIYLPEKESWIELGGAGLFRPEVLEPLETDTPVLAFGLGIERLAMIKYEISDIRMLYQSDISWLRDIPLTEGVNLE